MRIANGMSACLIVVLISAAGCRRPPEPPRKPPRGVECVVQFRRDALGAAAEVPVPPMTDTTNGSVVNIVGRFVDENREWVILEVDETLVPKTLPPPAPVSTPAAKIEIAAPRILKREYWIPKHTILLMSVPASEKPGKTGAGSRDEPPK